MTIVKTLRTLFKQDKEAFVVPKGKRLLKKTAAFFAKEID